MKLRLQELQEKNNSNQRFKVEMLEKNSLKDLETILHIYWMLYVLKFIRIKVISEYYNDMMAGHFDIEKT